MHAIIHAGSFVETRVNAILLPLTADYRHWLGQVLAEIAQVRALTVKVDYLAWDDPEARAIALDDPQSYPPGTLVFCRQPPAGLTPVESEVVQLVYAHLPGQPDNPALSWVVVDGQGIWITSMALPMRLIEQAEQTLAQEDTWPEWRVRL